MAGAKGDPPLVVSARPAARVPLVAAAHADRDLGRRAGGRAGGIQNICSQHSALLKLKSLTLIIKAPHIDNTKVLHMNNTVKVYDTRITRI